ncbi:unnamed protein product [Closterium sp. Yama58-4]|nr:unnamed protein product [Closterium sp. Yama58-4]
MIRTFPRVLLSWRRRLGTAHKNLAQLAAGASASYSGKAAIPVEWRPWVVRGAAVLLALGVAHCFLVVNEPWVDSLQLWNFFPLKSLPAVEWEEASPRPGCIVTLDSRYSPEGVQAVEAAVARLLRELGGEAEGERVGGGGEGIGGERIRGEGLGGEGRGGEEVGRGGVGAAGGDGGQEGRSWGMGDRDWKRRRLKEGAGEWEGRWHGGWRGRRLKGGGEEGLEEGDGGLNGEVKKAEGEKGEGEDEGKAEETDEEKEEGNDEGNGEEKGENEDSKVKEERRGRGGEAMPEAWWRFYEALPKVVDAEGNEIVWKFPIWVALAVNMLYARRHGYRLVVENGSRFTPDRHPSWFKVPLLQEQLACCCEWAFFLDSDAYMSMHHHTLSIPAWIQAIKQPSYFSWLLRDNLTDTLAGQVWLPQDPALLLQPPTALQPEGPVALIPRNGDSREGFFGDADALFRKDTDYLNAGVMLWRRSPHTFKFFQQWYSVPRGDYHLYGHVWEQARLNQVAQWPQWRARVVVVPYRELTGPQGAMLRHVWGNVTQDERARVVYEALEEALGRLK